MISRQKCPGNLVLSILEYTGILFLYYCTNPVAMLLLATQMYDAKFYAANPPPLKLIVYIDSLRTFLVVVDQLYSLVVVNNHRFLECS